MVIIGLGSALLQACKGAPPPLLGNEEILRQSAPGISDECVELFRKGGIKAVPRHTDQCFKMTEVKRWTGLLRVEFEGDQFCPAPATDCPSAKKEDMIWASFQGHRPEEGLYKAEFMGRQTLEPGHFGHMGVAEHEILVDQIIHIVAARR